MADRQIAISSNYNGVYIFHPGDTINQTFSINFTFNQRENFRKIFFFFEIIIQFGVTINFQSFNFWLAFPTAVEYIAFIKLKFI